MEADDEADGYATSDEIRIAIENLTAIEMGRLRKAATYCLPGSEFRDFQELINEAIVRTMNAAGGGAGRRWRAGVQFVAHLTMTVRGIADDSRESAPQRKTRSLETMAAAGDGSLTDDVLGALGHAHSSVLDMAVENQERIEGAERAAAAKADSEAIDALFKGDEGVEWIILGHKDGQSAAQIREISGMSQTQYNTARRRFRRGLGKLFPSRRAS